MKTRVREIANILRTFAAQKTVARSPGIPKKVLDAIDQRLDDLELGIDNSIEVSDGEVTYHGTIKPPVKH